MMLRRLPILSVFLFVVSCSAPPPHWSGRHVRPAQHQHRRRARGHQEAVVRRVRRPRARLEGRDADGALPDRAVQGRRPRAGQSRTARGSRKCRSSASRPSDFSPLVVKKGGQTHHVQARCRRRRVQPARDRRRSTLERLRNRLRRLRRAGARVSMGRLQGPRRQRQDASSCSSTIRRCRTRPIRRRSIRRPSAARR